jgi:hypothetical protein
MRRFKLGRKFALASAFALALGLLVPATAAQAIPAYNYYYFNNNEYGPGLSFPCSGNDNGGVGPMINYTEHSGAIACGGTFYITAGTYQEYRDYDDQNWCLSYDNSNDTLFEYPCEGATWQEWRSEQLSNGDWLIWNEWFTDAYPDYCGNYAAVITTNGGDNNNTIGAVYLACPGGGTYFTTNQEWIANGATGI